VQGPPSEAVHWFQPRNLMEAQAMEREESIVDRDKQKITGVTKPQQGVAMSKRQTRGEVQALLQKSSARMATIAEALNHTGVKPMLDWFVRLIVRYVEPQEVAQILNFRQPPPPLSRILDRDFEIEVRAGIQARSKRMRVQDMQHAMQVTGQVLKPFPRAQSKVGVQILKSMLPELGVEKSVSVLNQVEQMIDQAPAPQPERQGTRSGQSGGGNANTQ
jgi:hypothetical protein